jgi:5,10-methylene-tetrahydrofolate dehydrogenase/methenyl tetrahydrofolate cyclohydrolase
MVLILDGKQISNDIKTELKEEINVLKDKNIVPGLGIILVGERKDSSTYVRMKKKSCLEIGIRNFDIHLPEDVTQETIIQEVEKMNHNNEIHGILIQLPLPKHINEEEVIKRVHLNKDVDGFHPTNIGNLALNRLKNLMCPCTPEGCIEILDRYNISLEGKHVVILGRSNIVGLPLSLLFLHRNSTVTICHSRTKNLSNITKTADILVGACGKAKFIKNNDIKQDCVILDVGINSEPDISKKLGYKLVGDIDFNDVIDKCLAITPVPGGIGPMTIAMLLKHTVKLAKLL